MKARDASSKNTSIVTGPVLAAIAALLAGGLAVVPATSGQYGPKGTYRYMCTVHGFTGKVIVK